MYPGPLILDPEFSKMGSRSVASTWYLGSMHHHKPLDGPLLASGDPEKSLAGRLALQQDVWRSRRFFGAAITFGFPTLRLDPGLVKRKTLQLVIQYRMCEVHGPRMIDPDSWLLKS